jgi:hypothetical protein
MSDLHLHRISASRFLGLIARREGAQAVARQGNRPRCINHGENGALTGFRYLGDRSVDWGNSFEADIRKHCARATLSERDRLQGERWS